jgi:hypothetical protein
MNDLMSKLAISKKIMDRHNEIPRGTNEAPLKNSSPQVESFNPVQGNYNIPQEFVSQEIKENTQPITQDRILNSKLPDEIKKLMIENPIEKPTVPDLSTSFLSEKVIEGAHKLMGVEKKQHNTQTQKNITESIDLNSIRNLIRDTVRDTIKEELSKAGLVVEGESKSNETLQLKVGKHIFEGKVTKIKKVQ